VSTRSAPRAYRTLLWLYPRGFRRRFGPAMARMFADEMAEARARGGLALVRLWGRTVLDLLVSVPAAHFRRSWAVTPGGPTAHPIPKASTMDTLRRDFRLAVRSLKRHPTFALIALLTLALGIGANSAIFSVVNGVLLRPLPYPDAGRLVTIWTAYPMDSRPRFPLSAAEYLDYQAATREMREVGLYGTDGMTVTGSGPAERRIAAQVTRSLFHVLGATAEVGRTFSPEEDRVGGPGVVVLGYGYWTSHYGASPDAVGQTLTADATTYEIIGVLPPDFTTPSGAYSFYLPLTFDRGQITNRSGHNFRGVGRLAPGATMESARVELRSLLVRWEEEFAGGHANDPQQHPLVLVPLHDFLFANVRPMMWALLGAVGLVLLLAAANVANLLLARGEVRGREMGIRTALGARRSDLVRQLLTESVVLAGAGGGLGLLLATMGVRLMRSLAPGVIPRIGEVSLDWRVVAFTAGASVVTGLLFGALPGLQAGKSDVRAALTDGGRSGSGGRESRRALNGLVVVQMAFAVVLLIGSGLLLKSFLKLQAVDPGLEVDRKVAFFIALTEDQYPERDAIVGFFDRLLDGLAAIPGVEAVSAVRGLPLRSSVGTEGFTVIGRPITTHEQTPSVSYQWATPGYFRNVTIPLLRGREFGAGDRMGSPLVAVINETAATSYFPGEDPVGKEIHLLFAPTDWPPVTIVGVVGDVHQVDLAIDPRPQLYLPQAQVPDTWAIGTIRQADVVLRTDLPVGAVASSVTRVVQELDATVPVVGVRTLAESRSRGVATERFVTVLVGLFAVVALVISAVGVYGVLAFSVARRSREIGIRMALGAQPGQMLGAILRGAALIAAFGGGIGVVTALFATRMLESLVFAVSLRDPSIYVGSAALLLAVGLIASFVPAWRAASADPMMALREE